MFTTAKNMDWHNILTISLTDNFNLCIQAGVRFFVLAVLVLAFILIRLLIYKDTIFPDEIELNINLGGIGSVKIKQDREVAQIAHRAWTEFVTRKAGLEFDPEHDVIVDIYNSWYQLFDRIRALIREIPAHRVKCQNTQNLVKVLVDSLNKGLRPHLTKWQAKFRRWYDNEMVKEENMGKTPQEIQKLYPLYDDLAKDLVIINQQIISYTNEIKKLVR
jgi:hypothetical protein